LTTAREGSKGAKPVISYDGVPPRNYPTGSIRGYLGNSIAKL
jgi:hypothetical protein